MYQVYDVDAFTVWENKVVGCCLVLPELPAANTTYTGGLGDAEPEEDVEMPTLLVAWNEQL
jgi:hypothetical protein